MSFALSIELPAGDPAAIPAGLAAALSRGQILTEIGGAVADLLRAHFAEKEQQPNKMGWEKTGFYGDAARGVQTPRLEGAGAVTVAINKVGLAQRYFGGTIRAGSNGSGAKFLTIPAREEAYGKTAGAFAGRLKFVVLPQGGPALVYAGNEDRTLARGPRKGQTQRAKAGQEATLGEGGVVFWLRRSVTQAADPGVLPTPEEITAAAVGAASTYLERAQARSSTP